MRRLIWSFNVRMWFFNSTPKGLNIVDSWKHITVLSSFTCSFYIRNIPIIANSMIPKQPACWSHDICVVCCLHRAVNLNVLAVRNTKLFGVNMCNQYLFLFYFFWFYMYFLFDNKIDIRSIIGSIINEHQAMNMGFQYYLFKIERLYWLRVACYNKASITWPLFVKTISNRRFSSTQMV